MFSDNQHSTIIISKHAAAIHSSGYSETPSFQLLWSISYFKQSATLAGALKIRGRSAANAVMNQEAVTDMVLQEEMVETSAQEKVEMGSSEELAETGDIQIRENFAETALQDPG